MGTSSAHTNIPNNTFQRNTCISGPKGLVTNYVEGGATKREWGACEVLPVQKGGGENVLAMLKGGGTKRFWVVFMR